MRQTTKGQAFLSCMGGMLLVLTAVGDAWSQNTPPPVLDEVGIDQLVGAQVPLDLTFRDEQGEPVALKELFGERPVILALVYYECPMLCTEVLNGLVRSLRTLSFDVGSELDVITVSFDPGETPALARAKKEVYLDRYGRSGASQGWHFLTGDEASIQALTGSVGFRYVYLPGRDEYAHASGILVLTPSGQVSRYFFGIDYAPRDLRLALVEASQGDIGSAVDQVLLYCFHYDPETGKYGVVIMNVLRLAGIITVACIGVFVGVSLRLERKRRKRANGAQIEHGAP